MYPLSWYVFRPFFGAVIAFAIYLIYKAGQLALGAGGTPSLRSEVNIPILSVFALFSGLLAWQTLEMIEAKGLAWLKSSQRKDLYATGLERALRDTGQSTSECAAQVGRSLGQIERWIAGADRVTPEMQDRIATWLDRSINDLFGEQKRADDHQPKWAKGLAQSVMKHHIYSDIAALADRLDVDEARLRSWIDRDQPVPTSMQWALVDILARPHDELFEADNARRDAWAVGLRPMLAMPDRPTVVDLSKQIGVPAGFGRWNGGVTAVYGRISPNNVGQCSFSGHNDPITSDLRGQSGCGSNCMMATRMQKHSRWSSIWKSCGCAIGWNWCNLAALYRPPRSERSRHLSRLNPPYFLLRSARISALSLSVSPLPNIYVS